MYSTLPPQEGRDPKLSSIMPARPRQSAAAPSAAVASAVTLQRPHCSPSNVAKPVNMSAATMKQPPQVGTDPKLLACMNDGDAAISSSSHANFTPTMKQPPQVGTDPKLLACINDGDAAISSSPHANLSVAASPSQQQQLTDAAPPSKESIANSLHSFKQTSPITTEKKDLQNTNAGVMANFRPMRPIPVDSLTHSNQCLAEKQSMVDASINIQPETESHSMLTNVSSASIDAAAEPCINNSNFWLQEEEERFLLGLRMYGWGQWKRIQPIVKTRTNKQIKSHAQKREKVNPEIKIKYSKAPCRRGRISSGVLANDARVLSTNGGDLLTAIARDDQHQFPPLEQMVKDVYQTNNGDGPNSRVRRYRHTPYHRSTYHPQSPKVIAHSSPSTQEQESVTATATNSVPQEQLCKEASYSPGIEVYTRKSNGNWAGDIIQAVNSSGPKHLYLLRHNGEGDVPSVPEDLIMSKTRYEEMIRELDVRFGLPADSKLTWPHPLPGGTPVYAQWINRLNPDTHARWISGTVNSCEKGDDGYRYHILFDNEEEDHGLHEKSILHRLDYDKLFKQK